MLEERVVEDDRMPSLRVHPSEVRRAVLELLHDIDGQAATDRVTCFEAARYLGISATTVQRWCKRGRFPGAEKTSGETGEWRIPLDALPAAFHRRQKDDGKLWTPERSA